MTGLEPICYDVNKRLGYSVGFNGSLTNSLIGHTDVPCLQICYGNYNEGFINENLSQYSNMHLYLHSTVRTNIANMSSDYIVSSSIKHVRSLANYSSLHHSSVILHYGCSKDVSGTNTNHLNKVLDSLDQITRTLKPTNGHYPILLENAAGEGTEVGVTVEEIRYVLERCDNTKIGMCLDTCHAFSAGYHVDQVEQLTLLLEELEAITPRHLRMIHLNDSKHPFHSRKDRHENIGQGYVWSGDKSSLDYLMQYGAEMNLDFILETPNQESDLIYMRKNHMQLRRKLKR